MGLLVEGSSGMLKVPAVAQADDCIYQTLLKKPTRSSLMAVKLNRVECC